MLHKYIKSAFKLLKESLSQYVDNGKVGLYHYTQSDEPTLTLDPSRVGEQPFSRRERNFTTPRIFFYLDPKQKERFYKNATEYYTEVPASEIYDSILDPSGFAELVRQRNQGVLNIDDFLSTIRDTGFNGLYYRVQNRDIVVWFHPIQVNKREVISDTEHKGEVFKMNREEIIEKLTNNQVVVISANRGDLTPQQNGARTQKLKSDLKTRGYNFIKAGGGYIETHEDGTKVPVEEDSFMVWNGENIVDEAIKLGEKYGQETILFNDKGTGYLVGTKQGLDYIAYGQKDRVGTLAPDSKSEFFTRVGDFYFEYK